MELKTSNPLIDRQFPDRPFKNRKGRNRIVQRTPFYPDGSEPHPNILPSWVLRRASVEITYLSS